MAISVLAEMAILLGKISSTREHGRQNAVFTAPLEVLEVSS